MIGINNASKKVTLQDFRNLFDMDKKTGAFRTDLDHTRGTITLDKNGAPVNANRKWYQKQATATGADAATIRQQLVLALLDANVDMTTPVMKKILKNFGVNAKGTVLTAVRNPDGSADYEKPLERRLVKQILMHVDDQKEIASFEKVEKSDIEKAMKAEKNAAAKIASTFGVEMPVCKTELEQRFELYTHKVATALVNKFEQLKPDNDIDNVWKKKFTEKFGTDISFGTVLNKVREIIEEKIKLNADEFAYIFKEKVSNDTKEKIEADIKDVYGLSFQLLSSKSQVAEGNKTYGIASDFIRSADKAGSMTDATINGKPVEIPEDSKVIVTDENEEELKQQLGPAPGKDGDAKVPKFSGDTECGSIYNKKAGSFAHQILTQLPGKGANLKHTMLYLTSQISLSGPLSFTTVPKNMEKDYGFGSYAVLAEKGNVVQMTGGQHTVKNVKIEITEKAIVVKQNIELGPCFSNFDGIPLEVGMPFMNVTTSVTIPLQDENGNAINTDNDLDFGAEPKGLTFETSVETLKEQIDRIVKEAQKEVLEQA